MATQPVSSVIQVVLRDQLEKLRAKQKRQARTLQITTDQLLALEKELEGLV